MNDVRTSHLVAPLLALVAMAACNDSTSPGQTVDINAQDVLIAIESLVIPVRLSLNATTTLNDAVESLTDQGVEFDRRGTRIGEQLGIELTSAVSDVVFPPDFIGQTVVLDPETDTWVIDPDLTGAPSDGIRVLWYERLGDIIVFPLIQEGHIDLTDEDTADPLSRLGVSIVTETNAGTLVLADFLRGLEVTYEGDTEMEHVEASGTYGDAVTRVGFNVVSDIALDTLTSAEQANIDLTVFEADTGLSYRVVLDQSRMNIDDLYTGDWTITVVQNSVTTVLTLVVPEDENPTGTLSHGGTVIADVEFVSNQFRFTTPQGQQISSGQANNLSILTQAMLIGWAEVVNYLPLYIG
jgi:hypothetical protein